MTATRHQDPWRAHHLPSGMPKRSYTKAGAKKVVKRIGHGRPQVYRCPWPDCGQWHVGRDHARPSEP